MYMLFERARVTHVCLLKSNPRFVSVVVSFFGDYCTSSMSIQSTWNFNPRIKLISMIFSDFVISPPKKNLWYISFFRWLCKNKQQHQNHSCLFIKFIVISNLIRSSKSINKETFNEYLTLNEYVWRGTHVKKEKTNCTIDLAELNFENRFDEKQNKIKPTNLRHTLADIDAISPK